MHRLIIFIIFLSVFHKSNQLFCENTNNCICLRNELEYEFQCSQSKEDNILITVKENHIAIDCVNGSMLDFDIFPRFNESVFISAVQIEFCKFTAPKMPFLNADNVSRIEIKNTQLGALTSDFLQPYTALENLVLESCNISKVQDAFQYNSLLRTLELARNQIQPTEELFRNNTLLNFLDLSSNQLTKLPLSLFNSLGSLEVLNLGNNMLTSLQDNIFKGLDNLKALELRSNQLKDIQLNSLPNLIGVSLSENRLEKIPQDLFSSNTNLELIELRANPGIQLPDFLFSNLQQLQEVDLSKCGLENVPRNLFQNSTSLLKVKLQGNRLRILPKELFQTNVNLKELHLEHNQLASVQDVFANLRSLEKLNLAGNSLKNPEHSFEDLENLVSINLKANRIANISEVFFNNTNLIYLNLNQNLLKYSKEIFKGLAMCKQLEEIQLSWNDIAYFNGEEMFELLHLKFIDLSHNQITSININNLRMTATDLEINVESNLIEHFEVFEVEDEEESTNFRLIVADNPINCDCNNLNFAQFLQKNTEIVADNLTCNQPRSLQGQFVKELPFEMFTCPLGKIENCLYLWRPLDTTVVVNCSQSNFTQYPNITIPQNVNFNQTELILAGNLLTKGPPQHLIGIENVTRLRLGGNQIRAIDWLPPRLEVLELDNNQLGDLNGAILNFMNGSSVKRISLQNNPWKCDCSILNFTRFLQENSNKLDSQEIYCANSTKLVVRVHKNEVCTNWLFPAIFLLSLLFLVFAVNTALYYRYQQEVKVWCFAKNLCLFWITEEEVDQDKKYDAFISFSHKDEDFVVRQLVSVLESSPNPYKLCLYYRHFIPGEFIINQITSAVLNSRRTIVVLSPHFLQSVWAKTEFRTAHTQAMTDGHARVIVVLYGEVDLQKLDPELQIYLKTKIYLRWGDPYFWNKLRFALPHYKHNAE